MASDLIAKAMTPASDGNYKVQYRILRDNDHQLRWVRVQGKVFFDNKKRPERFIGTVLDITEEQNKEQQLRENIELFTMMADNMPVMIWMSGSDKFNDYFNNTWLEFTGRSIEQESQDGWLEGV